MSTTPPKRIGRPKKSPMEKGGQFSIRLPLLSKLMLEMIARDRNMSLSQAVEYVIKEMADAVDLNDGVVSALAREGLALLLEHTDQRHNTARYPGSPLPLPPTGRHLGHLTEAERAIAFPESLRNEHEQLFYEVIRDLDYHHGSHVLRDKMEAMELFEMCRTAQMTGMKQFQVVESWLSNHPAPEPQVIPKVRSGPSVPKPTKKS